jgi:hypothetical protein
MSIFKESFKEGVRNQLEIRQNVINERTPQNLQYMNSRNAWIRMSSAVNIYNGPSHDDNTDDENERAAALKDYKDPSKYSNSLAKQYILQGGTLSPNGTLKAGLGTFDKNAYSNTAADGSSYRLGIRPMPGITSVNVKSRGAYGSLQDVTVNFQCWDIKQLEDLELLYMRPGYTVLVEWGWAPYINNKGEYQPNFNDFYDIIDNPKPKETIWKDLDKRSTETYSGNVESMFGYVKNYSWNARMDGGYDCQVTIITLGEILESLKVNYLPAQVLSTVTSIGLLAPNITSYTLGSGSKSGEKNNVKWEISKMNLSGSYSQNILAGIFEELWDMGQQASSDATNDGQQIILHNTSKHKDYAMFHKTINIGTNENGNVTKTDEQIYISLESLTDILNDYVLLSDKNSYVTASSPLAGISTKDKDGNPLLCLAHPLQVSMDPSVCLIQNNLWADGLKFTAETIPNNINPANGNTVVRYSNTDYADLFNFIVDPKGGNADGSANENAIINKIVILTGRKTNEFRELQRQFLDLKANPNSYPTVSQTFKTFAKNYSNFYDLLDKSALNQTELNKVTVKDSGTDFTPEEDSLEKINRAALTSVPTESQKQEIQQRNNDLNAVQSKGAGNLKFLNNIGANYFYNGDWKTELGVIGNIFLNVTMLYNLSVDKSLAAQDSKEKSEIALYDFIKNVLSRVNESIGSVNNFEMFIDPKDSIGRIIDINYVDTATQTYAYNNAFVLQVHNLNSVVRSYKFESKIFPNQSSQVAIGAQVGGGALGVDASSLIAFNKRIIDRIIPIKDAPTAPENEPDDATKFANLFPLIKTIYTYFNKLESGWFSDSGFDLEAAGSYKTALRDLIAFFVAITKSKIKNRAILPTVLSVEMDGIGGVIIGNIFRIPDEVIPKGYKGGYGGYGAKLGHIVTGLGHSLQNGDWVTKIDAQTIILDEPTGIPFDINIDINDATATPTVKVSVDIKGNVKPASSTGGATKIINGKVRNNGQIDDILVPMRADLYARHYSSVNQSDGKKIRLQAEVMNNLQNLLIDAWNAGIYLKVNSAYRTKTDQDRVWSDNCLNVPGSGKCMSRPGKNPAAVPGTSNHGFGAAVDLANKDGTRININGLSGGRSVPKTLKEWNWLQANKHKYNFDNNTPGLSTTSESHHFNYTG